MLQEKCSLPMEVCCLVRITKLLPLFLAAALAEGALVPDIRRAISADDFGKAERLIAEYRSANGITPEMLEAYSWLGRGAFTFKRYDQAEKYAAATKSMAVAELAKRKLDAERALPIALGAAIEVQAQVLAARGQRDQAVHYLKQELNTYRDTSIRTRIQKNINLLSLEGKPVPALEHFSAAAIRGKPALLFFWAHWCPDCKSMAPVLAKLKEEFGKQGLVLVAPTQTYGYAEKGREVPPAEEVRYIHQIRSEYYPALSASEMPVSAENFKNFGSSTTPTLVLVDRAGVVRLYHPGKMSFEELAPKVKETVSGRPTSPPTDSRSRPSPAPQ